MSRSRPEDAPPGAAEWELHPTFILRSTGFPFAVLDRISFPRTAALIDAALDADEAVAGAAAEAVACLRDHDGVTDGRLRRRLWKSLSRHRPLPDEDGEQDAATREVLARYRAALEGRERAWEAARSGLAAELPERRAALRDLAADERFQEAVWLSSPQMYERGLRGHVAADLTGPRTGRVRSLERQLAGYLQRVAAKNETASFFGPINYGDFTPPGEERPRAGAVTRRHAYIAYWVVQALADRLAEEPSVRPYLRPRLSPLAAVSAGARVEVTLARARTVTLAGRAAEVLPLVDGRRDAAELARLTGAPVDEVVAALERLAGTRLVAFGIDLPVTEPRALEALLDRVAGLPGDCAAREVWLGRLSALRAAQQEFAGADFARRKDLLADLEQTVAGLTGLEPRRAGGRLYADRLVITEECLGDATPLRLGDAVLDLLTAELAPVLDLLAAAAIGTHAALTATATAALGLTGGGRVPLTRYLAHPWPEQPLPPAPPAPWRTVIEEKAAGGEAVVLDPADVAVAPGTLAGRALVCSPDVMIVARDLDAVRAGDFTLVLAESHDTALLWGWALQFAGDPAAAQAEVAALLDRLDTSHPLANMLTAKRAKIVPFEFPGPTVEAAQPSHRTDGRTIPAGQVDVVARDGRLLLAAPGHDGFLLYNGELDSPAHNVLAPPRVRPVTFGAPEGVRHTPRISVGRTVIQRERWLVDRDELTPDAPQGTAGDESAFALFVAVRRAVRRHGLPRWTFVKIPGERKPVLLDTEGLFLAELVAHLSEPGTDLTLSEMLPGPGDLWLPGPDGAHCAELRLVAARAVPQSLPETSPEKAPVLQAAGVPG
ncbi:lantibiotic dehydratase [Sphaerisporangium sp. B11E5]|uniref:lantibiotic dehydratase n=1 Tax=Sphaerisporangium sp. B11E5 TaxID=3153563 RepID=UPI00325C7A39